MREILRLVAGAGEQLYAGAAIGAVGQLEKQMRKGGRAGLRMQSVVTHMRRAEEDKRPSPRPRYFTLRGTTFD